MITPGLIASCVIGAGLASLGWQAVRRYLRRREEDRRWAAEVAYRVRVRTEIADLERLWAESAYEDEGER